MKTRNLTLLTLAGWIGLAFCLNAQAYTRPHRYDVKLASQQMIEKRTLTTPTIASVAKIINNKAITSTSATTTVSTGLTDPDVCRALSITAVQTDDVPAGDITINGTNALGATMAETFTLLAEHTSTVNGVEAFCTVSSVVFPIQDGDGTAVYDIGTQDVLGLHRCMAEAGHVIFATLDGAYEATRPTVIADTDEVEKNTVDLNGTLDGAKDVEVFFIQNFGCLD